MKRRLIALALLLCLLLSACGGEAARTPAPEPAELAAPYAGDYALLWDTLERDYPYLPYLESRGIDLTALRESYRAELETVTDSEAFAGLLQRLLRELGNFAHLNLLSPEMYQMYAYVMLLDPETAHLPENGAFEELLRDERLAPRYQMPEDPESYRQRGAAAQLPQVQVSYYPDCRALCIRCPSFSQELAERDRDIVSLALEKYPETEHIIFDITGNTGGSDYYWMNNLVAPFGGSYPFTYRSFYRQGELFDRYYGASLDSAGPIPPGEDVPDWVEDLGLDACFTTRAELPFDGEYNGAPVETKARRWLLVDQRVFSASDKFACFCKSSGWATVVGRRTAGDGLGTTPVLVLLPDSGLLLRLGLTAGENPGGGMNGEGTGPDVLCVRDETPLSRCLALIREGQ